MGLINRFKNRSQVVTRYKMMSEIGNGYYSWDGNVYRSDLVRACIRPKVKAIGKLTAKHVRRFNGRWMSIQNHTSGFFWKNPTLTWAGM